MLDGKKGVFKLIDVDIFVDDFINRLMQDDSNEITEIRKMIKPLRKNELSALTIILAKMYEETNKELELLKNDIVLKRSQINRDGRPAIDESIITEIHKLHNEGWSVRKIGEYLGVSKSTVSNYTK